MSEGRIQKGEAMKSLKRVLLPIVFLGVYSLMTTKPEEVEARKQKEMEE